MATRSSVKLTAEQAQFVKDYAKTNGISFNQALEHMVSFFVFCVYTQDSKKKQRANKKSA